jgi:hypothetical protein
MAIDIPHNRSLCQPVRASLFRTAGINVFAALPHSLAELRRLPTLTARWD